MPTGRVFAVGGLSPAVDDTALFRHLVGLVDAVNPTVCFLPTASDDDPLAIQFFYAQFGSARCRPSHLELTKHADPAGAAATLGEYDIVYVGGGATAAMLDCWRRVGADAALRRAWEAGTVLAGDSAGAMCWFAAGITDSLGPALAPLPGLAFLDGSLCPHYDEPDRREIYRRMVAERRIDDGWGVTDGAALHIVDGAVVAVVTSRADAGVYRVKRSGSRAIEHRLASTPV